LALLVSIEQKERKKLGFNSVKKEKIFAQKEAEKKR